MAPDTDRAAPGSCCASFYEQDWVHRLAEDSFHPGGADLTRRTVAGMGLDAGATLLDLGSGTGTSALMVAREFGLSVTGLDASEVNVTRARERAAEAAAADPAPAHAIGELQFLVGDAGNPDFPAASFDGVLAECVFSLMPAKGDALTAYRRLLGTSGAPLAFTDMALGDGTIDQDLLDAMAPWTCLTGALTEEAYVQLAEDAGFRTESVVDESAGLTEVVRKLKRRLLLAGAGEVLAGVGALPFDLATAKGWLDRFQAAVDNGGIRYLRMHFRLL